MPRASYSQGVHGAGARSYTPAQAQRIKAILESECQGYDQRMTVEDLAARVNMSGRAVRDAIRDLEVARQILTDFGDGYFVCQTVEEAERSTRRLESQVANMQQRIEARREMTAELGRTQGLLWG